MSKQDATTTSSPATPQPGFFSGLFLRARWLFAGFILALAAAWSQGDRGPAEEIGQAVDRATRSASSWVGSTSKTEPRKSDLASQVDNRLDSDKGLDSSQIEVRPGADGAIELHGMVANPEAKDRAVALARDTRGTRQVVDQLAILPKPRVVSSPDEPSSVVSSRSLSSPADLTTRRDRTARSTSTASTSLR